MYCGFNFTIRRFSIVRAVKAVLTDATFRVRRTVVTSADTTTRTLEAFPTKQKLYTFTAVPYRLHVTVGLQARLGCIGSVQYGMLCPRRPSQSIRQIDKKPTFSDVHENVHEIWVLSLLSDGALTS